MGKKKRTGYGNVIHRFSIAKRSVRGRLFHSLCSRCWLSLVEFLARGFDYIHALIFCLRARNHRLNNVLYLYNRFFGCFSSPY